MKKFGSKSGFTLVELIVVIAILGILAGIAVPAYSGYIKKANQASDYAQLDAIKTAIVFAYTDKHVNDADFKDITEIEVSNASGDGNAPFKIKAGGAEITDVTADMVKPYYDLKGFKFKSDTSKATWYATEETGTTKHPAGWVLTPKDTTENPPAGSET